jgi:hypothetical protein
MTTNAVESHSRHGSADLEQQIRAYHGFMLGLRYIVLALIVSGSFLVLAFCTSAGWGVSAFVALVELIVGLYFAEDRDQVTWPSVFGGLFISTAAESGLPIEERLRADAARGSGEDSRNTA